MGEQSHTPGPWEYDKCGRAGWTIWSKSSGGEVVLSDDLARYGAIESEADARLIAASPDLLEACERAEQFIANGVEMGFIRLPDADCPDPAHRTLPAIRAAIAKAKGADQ